MRAYARERGLKMIEELEAQLAELRRRLEEESKSKNSLLNPRPVRSMLNKAECRLRLAIQAAEAAREHISAAQARFDELGQVSEWRP